MQAERDFLKNIVFPKVEEELQKQRIKLEIVDLRWGVDTTSLKEEEREATVLKDCLEEIRYKPFFIRLLGNRYGWVHPEERMQIATMGEKLILPTKGKSFIGRQLYCETWTYHTMLVVRCQKENTDLILCLVGLGVSTGLFRERC